MPFGIPQQANTRPSGFAGFGLGTPATQPQPQPAFTPAPVALPAVPAPAKVYAGGTPGFDMSAGLQQPTAQRQPAMPTFQPAPMDLPQFSFSQQSAPSFSFSMPSPSFSGASGGISAAAQEMAKLQAQIARQQLDQQNKLISEAAAYDTPGRRAEEEGRANADIALAYGNAARDQRSRFAQAGLSPESGRFQSLEGQLGLSQAADSAGAINSARRAVEQEGFNRRVGASDLSLSSRAAGDAAGTQGNLDSRDFDIQRASALDRYNAESDNWNRNFQTAQFNYGTQADAWTRNRQSALDQYTAASDNWNRNRQSSLDLYAQDSENYTRGRQQFLDQFEIDSKFYDRSRQQVLDRAGIDQNAARIGLSELAIRSGANTAQANLDRQRTADQFAAIGGLAQGAGWAVSNWDSISSIWA